MQNYKVVNIEDTQIVQDLDTNEFYVPSQTYAKMAGTSNLNVEKKAEEGMNYTGILYNPEGWEGVQSVYLIPIAFVFNWLMIDNPAKALMIGNEAVIESIKNQFADEVAEEEAIENN